LQLYYGIQTKLQILQYVYMLQTFSALWNVYVQDISLYTYRTLP